MNNIDSGRIIIISISLTIIVYVLYLIFQEYTLQYVLDQLVGTIQNVPQHRRKNLIAPKIFFMILGTMLILQLIFFESVYYIKKAKIRHHIATSLLSSFILSIITMLIFVSRASGESKFGLFAALPLIFIVCVIAGLIVAIFYKIRGAPLFKRIGKL